MTVDDIRAKYPTPHRDADALVYGPESYCIGGALCLMVEGTVPIHWPTEDHLAHVLRTANPALDEEAAYHFAYHIVAANDCGWFESGWRYL